MNDQQQNDAPGQNKSYEIIVNGRPRIVTEHKLTYLQAIKLAFPDDTPSEKMVFTVTYSNPHGRDGMLVEGEEVVVKDGMIFNVTKTNES